MLNPGECLLLCITVVLMASGNIGLHIPIDVIHGQSVYLRLPIQAKSHSVIWSFRKMPFIDVPCHAASRDEHEIQWQSEVFPDGSLKLINVTCSHQGRYVASMIGKDSSATVIHDLYVWPPSDNESVKKRTDEKPFTLRTSEAVGIVLGILCVLVIAVIIFLLLKTKGKVQVTEYENANMPPPHTYVNTSASAHIRVPRTDSADPGGHYQPLTHPDGAVYSTLRPGNTAL